MVQRSVDKTRKAMFAWLYKMARTFMERLHDLHPNQILQASLNLWPIGKTLAMGQCHGQCCSKCSTRLSDTVEASQLKENGAHVGCAVRLSVARERESGTRACCSRCARVARDGSLRGAH